MIIGIKSYLYKEYKNIIKNDLSLCEIINKIKKIYKVEYENDSKRIFDEKFKLESKINSIEKTDVIPYLSLLLSILFPSLIFITGDVLSKAKGIEKIAVIKFYFFIVFVILAISVIILTAVNDKINKLQEKQKSFYILCLKIIKMIEAKDKRNIKTIRIGNINNKSKTKAYYNKFKNLLFSSKSKNKDENSNFKVKKDKYHDRMLKELENIESGCYENTYSNDKMIYERLKNYYLDKIKDPNFNVRIERIGLEKRLGMYNGFSIISSNNFYIALYGVFISVFLNLILQKINNNYINIPAVIIIFTPIMLLILKDITKDKPKHTLYFIALKVLDEIEKDLSKNNINTVEFTKEVVATIDENVEKKVKKRIRKYRRHP